MIMFVFYGNAFKFSKRTRYLSFLKKNYQFDIYLYVYMVSFIHFIISILRNAIWVNHRFCMINLTTIQKNNIPTTCYAMCFSTDVLSCGICEVKVTLGTQVSCYIPEFQKKPIAIRVLNFSDRRSLRINNRTGFTTTA